MSRPSAYTAAYTRYEAAMADMVLAREAADRMMAVASDECDAAEAGLRVFESAPGIPLPRYQEGS